jgi:hypothetical protein
MVDKKAKECSVHVDMQPFPNFLRNPSEWMT